jgi:septum formation protein
LTSYGIRHRVIDVDVDDGELCPHGRDPRSWVMALAYLKAAAGRAACGPDLEPVVLLGADTVCVHDGEIIGQPRDEAHARRMIAEFSDREHLVLTGVALVDQSGLHRDVFMSLSRVQVGALSQREIEDYVRSGLWRGKAGGYNLRERIDAGWPVLYDGDPTGVMGLPMSIVVPRLSQFAKRCRASQTA